MRLHTSHIARPYCSQAPCVLLTRSKSCHRERSSFCSEKSCAYTSSACWHERQGCLTRRAWRHASVVCKSGNSGSDDASPPEGLSWERLTQRLVSGATLVFFFLLVPQIIKNASNLLRGDTTALVAVAWVGYLTALLGNVMLLNYFLKRREDGGALVQAVGAVTNIVVLSQTYLAGTMPAAIYFATAALVGLATVLCGLKRLGTLDSAPAARVWNTWDDFLGLVGVSSLTQASASTFANVQSRAPGVLGLCAAASILILDRNDKMPQSCKGLWDGVPAWSATFLFAFQPIAQLVKNFSVPSSLGGLSKATVLLAMIGNGLMVPRALLTRDKVWLAGSAWASFTGWFQLFSLFLNRSPSGPRYLGLGGFLAATAVYLTYNILILRKDMQAKRLPVSPLSMPKLLSRS